MKRPPRHLDNRTATLLARPFSGFFGLIYAALIWITPPSTDAASKPGLTPPAAKPSAESVWWSLKPLIQPTVPSLKFGQYRITNPIDSFVVATLAVHGIQQSPEADRRTLLRRLSFDLTGLPPSPQEIEHFISDPSARAYENQVDRLLASPHYGERWARHWLDVVHYGETHGYDKDQPRPNAWPYRDYVVRSFNEDKPYARFIQEQLAGDSLFPDTRDGFEALGFISAGPWDFIGHAEVPETKMDGLVARHLDRDDMVATTFQTFNSLTVQCAQCHDHKFDPIAQEEYYRLQSVFSAVDRADKPYDTDPIVARARRELTARQKLLVARKSEIDRLIIERAGSPLIQLDKKVGALSKSMAISEAMGYHSAIETKQAVEKWVQVDLGSPRPLVKIVLHPCKDDFNGIGEGFGFPLRFKVETSDDPDFKKAVFLAVDSTSTDYVNPKLKPVGIELGQRLTRFIRVTATKLAPRQNDYIFALAELNAVLIDGSNVARNAAVSALDSIEAPVRWQKLNLTDGWQPGASSVEGKELLELKAERITLLTQATSASDRSTLASIQLALAEATNALGTLPATDKVFVGAVHKGSGAFLGTGSKGGKPRTIRVLNRGSIQSPGKEVSPAALSCLPGVPADFNLASDHPEGARRAALAQWLARTDNPLTWRSAVNRVWHYHFGRGIVDSPNDFGRMGGLPTHPELLDWLAADFRDGGHSFKKLHRLIVTSATYRQSSARVPAFDALDSDNRYLWRSNRRKLDAESLRDSVLKVSGVLNLKMGGPSFRDFVIEKPEHSPHYEYQLHDPEDPLSHRRSIYRFIVRSQQQPFMTTLDCADPSIQVGRRNESLSPLQALALMNNSLMLTMSKRFAARLDNPSGDLQSKVATAHYEALGHPASPADTQALVAYASEFGLPNLCRLLFNLNEFTFVD